MKNGVIAAGSLALGLIGVHAEAASLNITGVETDVTVTADLAGLGLAPSTFGTATAVEVDQQLVVTFPITGGALNLGTGAALIEHDGSGVTLSALADPTLSATVGNFLIDTDAGLISGDVIASPIGSLSGVPFFSLGAPTAQGLTLGITTELAGALTGIFGAPDLTDATFGFGAPEIATAPAPIPVPGAFALMATAVVALGAYGARRRAG
jgi:hypothetical protein